MLVTGRVGWDDWDTFGVREAVISGNTETQISRLDLQTKYLTG